jgi:hypothetical protein
VRALASHGGEMAKNGGEMRKQVNGTDTLGGQPLLAYSALFKHCHYLSVHYFPASSSCILF